jgi:hypothetical protein
MGADQEPPTNPAIFCLSQSGSATGDFPLLSIVCRCSPLFSDFAGVMSLEMSLAASVFRAQRVGESPRNCSFETLRR